MASHRNREDRMADYAALCEALRSSMGLDAMLDSGMSGRLEVAPRNWAHLGRPTPDCALDVLVEGLPIAERVWIQRAAKDGGYVRPWSRS